MLCMETHHTERHGDTPYRKTWRHTIQKGMETHHIERHGDTPYRKTWRHTIQKGMETHHTERHGDTPYRKAWRHTIQKGMETNHTERHGDTPYRKPICSFFMDICCVLTFNKHGAGMNFINWCAPVILSLLFSSLVMISMWYSFDEQHSAM